MNTDTTVIEVKNLSVEFGSFKAVDDITFSVKKGEIFGFLGANGAGKTTTIRTICGILNPSSGKIYVYGKDVSQDTSSMKNKIGYMSQKFTLYNDLTVNENIEFQGALHNMDAAEIKEQTQKLFKFINFSADANSIVSNLPIGTKQTVALCSTLLHDPDLIFLDEPTAGVAPAARKDFWRLIKELALQRKTIFITTHYMDEAEYADRIVLMKDGKIIALGAPNELKKQFGKPILEEVFLKAVSGK